MDIEFAPADVERFWARVDKSDPDGHWYWSTSVDRPYFLISGRRTRIRARKAALLLHGMDGDTPARCRTPRCINPFCGPERRPGGLSRRSRALASMGR